MPVSCTPSSNQFNGYFFFHPTLTKGYLKLICQHKSTKKVYILQCKPIFIKQRVSSALLTNKVALLHNISCPLVCLWKAFNVKQRQLEGRDCYVVWPCSQTAVPYCEAAMEIHMIMIGQYRSSWVQSFGPDLKEQWKNLPKPSMDK